MPDNIQITISGGNFPQGYCYPNSPQQFLNDLVLQLFATVQGGIAFNFGPNRPTPDQQNLPWLRTDNTGIIDGWYTFSGDWIRPYPVPGSSAERRLWTDTEAALLTYDGGSNATVSDRTGPFWQVDHNFDFKIPIGPNVVATSYGTIVNVNDTGGAEKAVLDTTVIPNHQHLMPPYFSPTWFGQARGLFWDGSTGNVPVHPATPVPFVQGAEVNHDDVLQLKTAFNGDPAGGPPSPLNLMNPYRGAFFIKRTARTLIVAP